MSSTTTTTPATTTITDRATLPAAGTWTIDPAHSSIEAIARHLVVSKVRGRFTSFSGTVTVGEDITESTVDVSIEAASIETGDEQRDGHLKSPDFLDVEQYPQLTFAAGDPRPAGDRWVLPGQLTIRGVARPVELEVDFLGLATDPWGNAKSGFHATTEIDREDFGMTWNQALETGGVLVGKTLRIELDVQLQRQDG